MAAGEMLRTLSLELDCQPAALVATRDAVRNHLLQAGVGEATRSAVDLVLEELLGNTIRYGSAGRGARASVTLAPLEHGLLLVLEDDGRAFDPTAHPEPERPASLAAARIGGLGISMVRKVTRAMRYSRVAHRNRLEVELELRGDGAREA